MARVPAFTNPKDQAICELHRRYVEVMESRLESISDASKDHYLRVLTGLTEKLAIPAKPLAEIVGEMMSEAAPLLLQAMQR
jgi:hypothetical protein